MQISCGFPPGPGTVEHIVRAEELGFERAWLWDSPALYGDIWVIAALAAQRTTRIGLGPAVLVPNLRHPLAQASAIATLEQLAPGRIAAAIGTGFTGRMAMGQKPLTWKYTRTYIAQLRGLLRGETVEVDGGACRMLHEPEFAPPFPINTPIIVAANGPKGMAVAEEFGDGVMTIGGGSDAFDWVSVLMFGTVLDAGEEPTSDRALAAAGPGLAVVYHAMYEGDPASVEGLPGGVEWRKATDAFPEHERHLAIHEGHFYRPNERDQMVVPGNPMLPAFTWTGTADEIKARIDAAGETGINEMIYAPMGPDIDRELEAFLTVAQSR
jgi:5,10-methylenetetrahydromethanopterin reductase